GHDVTHATRNRSGRHGSDLAARVSIGLIPRPIAPRSGSEAQRRGRLRGASAALRITAVQARHAAVEQNGGGRVALRAELSALRERILGEGVALLVARLELGALLLDQLLLLGIGP